MFEINVLTIMSTMGIRYPSAWLQSKGLGRSFANSVIHGRFSRLDFKSFEMLCRILKCTPNQIIVYRPRPNEKFDESHPFYALRYTPPLQFPAHILRGKTASQLAELYQKMEQWNAESKG